MPIKSLRLTPPEPTEADIQRASARRMQAAGYLVVRQNGGGFRDGRGRFVKNYLIAGLNACAGLPDLLCFKGERFIMLEIKKRGGKLSAAQLRFHAFAARFGVEVVIVEGVAGLDALAARLESER